VGLRQGGGGWEEDAEGGGTAYALVRTQALSRAHGASVGWLRGGDAPAVPAARHRPVPRRSTRLRCGLQSVRVVCWAGGACLGGSPDVLRRVEGDLQGTQGALLAEPRLERLPPSAPPAPPTARGSRRARRRNQGVWGASGEQAVEAT
jgi:hypothetical protein